MSSNNWRNITQFFEVAKQNLVCFKIVPDKSITNHSNYKFFKDVAELESRNVMQQVTSGVKSLVSDTFMKKEKKGYKMVFKPSTDYIWYEIMMKENEISFYVVCYEENADFVLLKLEQAFPKAPIEEVDVSETAIPYDDTVIADMNLQRHNFFSIKTDYGEQAQPVQDVLACSEDIREGDVLKFSMRVKPSDMNYWSYKCEEWHKKTLKGKAPIRLRITKDGVIGALFGLSDIAFHKLSLLFRELHSIAFKKQKTQQIVVNHASAETREIGGISRQTGYKQTAPVFKANIRVASHSTDEVRRTMNMKSLTNAFDDLKDSNNALIRTTIYENPSSSFFKMAHKEVSEHKVTPLSVANTDFMIMCDRELGKVMQLPTAKLQKAYADKMDVLQRSEVGIPEVFLKPTGVFLGKTSYKGEEFETFFPADNPDEAMLPIISSGIMGSGKDTFAANFIVENALMGKGAVILDVVDEVDRGMSDAIIKTLPPEKLVVLDFGNEEYVPYLDWAEAMRTEDRFTQNKFASELVKFFETEDEAGVQTERYLREAAKALPNGTVIQMGLMFTSPEFLEKTIADCEKRKDISTAAFWKLYQEIGDGRKKQIADPILNRLHKLVGDPALKVIFGQQGDGSINFDEWLYDGKVIICKVPKDIFTSTGIRTIVHWLTVKTWLTKQAMKRQGKYCQSYLVMNEPHQFLTKSLASTLEEIYPESRKFGLCVFSLFHDFAQIPKDLGDIMISSGCNFVVLKQNSDKLWKKFLHRIEPDFSLEDCMELKMHEAMVGVLADKKNQPVIRVKMNDLPYKRGLQVYDNADYIKECLTKYGKPIEEVQEAILEDELLLMNVGNKKKK